MEWVLIIVGTWVAVAAAVALVLGRAIHSADVRDGVQQPATLTGDEPRRGARPVPAGAQTPVPLPRRALVGR